MDEYIIHKLYRIQPADSPALIELLGKYDPAEIVNIEDPIFVSIAWHYLKRKSFHFQ